LYFVISSTPAAVLMKKLLWVAALFVAFQSSAQISFTDNTTSWEQLSKSAKKDKKLLFIHFSGSDCEQCNEVANKGFSSPLLKKEFDSNFLSIQTDFASENGKNLAKKFGIERPLVSLFVDTEGNILNRFDGTTSNPHSYLASAQQATRRKAGKQLSDYEKEYKTGQKSAAFLKSYIQKRQEAHLPTQELLDEYVGTLPVDSLSNFQVVRFIYQQGPTLDSRAYKLIQASGDPYQRKRSLVDSIYKSIPYQEAVRINQAIISNSFNKAVQNKDQQLAYQTGGFIQQSYGKDYNTGRFYSQRNLIGYYYETKDTAQYFRNCQDFLNHTHLLLTVDSLKRMDEAAFETARLQQTVQGPQGEHQSVQFAPPSQHFHMDLNQHAWYFYQMNNKPRDLEQALMWSKRSMEWFDELRKDKNHMPLGQPAYMDTYAHLLYKLNRKPEAIEWQTKAVEAQKVSGMSWTSMEKDLNEMKAGTMK
jgi:thioredoxin-related protein